MSDATCAIEGCQATVKARGWCPNHYSRWQRNGDPEKIIRLSPSDATCSIAGCFDRAKARGWCSKHYQRWKANGDPEATVQVIYGPDSTCSIGGCSAPARSLGWCSKHYQRWQSNGDPEVVQRSVRAAHSPLPTCAVGGCDRGARTRGWCPMHYTRWRLYGDPLVLALERVPRRDSDGRRLECSVDGCSESVHTRGWCRKHYGRWAKHGDPLVVHKVMRPRRSPEEMASGTKVCVVCQVRLTLDDFAPRKDSPDGRRYECRQCFTKKYNDRATERARNDPEYAARRRERHRAYAARRGPEWKRERNRASKLRIHYGLSPVEYEALAEQQGGRCAICGSLPGDSTARKKHLAVDHDHATGKVRALLCDGCNTGIGQFREDPERLLAAVEYLLKHKE